MVLEHETKTQFPHGRNFSNLHLKKNIKMPVLAIFIFFKCKLLKIVNNQELKFDHAENAFLFLFLKLLTI